MNTLSLESLLITEEEWVATEGIGSAIKKAGSAVWGAIKTLCKKILNAIMTLFKRNKKIEKVLKEKSDANPQDERWKNINRDQFMKSKARLVGDGEVKPTTLHKNTPLSLPAPGDKRPDNGGDELITYLDITADIFSFSAGITRGVGSIKTAYSRITNDIYGMTKSAISLLKDDLNQLSETERKYPPIDEFLAKGGLKSDTRIKAHRMKPSQVISNIQEMNITAKKQEGTVRVIMAIVDQMIKNPTTAMLQSSEDYRETEQADPNVQTLVGTLVSKMSHKTLMLIARFDSYAYWQIHQIEMALGI